MILILENISKNSTEIVMYTKYLIKKCNFVNYRNICQVIFQFHGILYSLSFSSKFDNYLTKFLKVVEIFLYYSNLIIFPKH